MKKISCIICAYNEENRIGKVLDVVVRHPLIDEVIVAEDGSTDRTVEVIRSYKTVKLLEAKKNRGKTKALLSGLKAARNNEVLLLDADLKNLTQADVTALLRPVLDGKVDWSLSLRRNSLAIHRLIGLDFSSGERVFDKTVLSGHETDLQKLPKFGFEVYMNKLMIAQKKTFAVVYWNKVDHARKTEKMGWLKGEWSEVKMAYDMVSAIGLGKIISQNRQLLKWRRAV